MDKTKPSPILNVFRVPEEPSLRNLTSDYSKPKRRQNEFLKTLGAPHVESFNHFLGKGLSTICDNIRPIEFEFPNGHRVVLSVQDAELSPPKLPDGTVGVRNLKIWPTECRQGAGTYKGLFTIKLCYSIDGVIQSPIQHDMGEIPIMVQSDACHLSTLSPEELISKGEHADEWGGYFIIKGNEKLVRMLLMTRRNYPIAVIRNSWKKRGNLFSNLGVLLRSVTEDHTSVMNVLHFVDDGSASLMFFYKKAMYFVPLILLLKCLLDVPDVYIFHQLVGGYEDDLYYRGCIINMLQSLHQENIHSHTEAKVFVGNAFRVRFGELPAWKTDEEICEHIITNCLAIHLDSKVDKFNLYVMMTQKLFMVVREKNSTESVDCVMVQEVLLGGHLYQQFIKEKLLEFLLMLKSFLLRTAKACVKLEYKLTPVEMVNALRKCKRMLENQLSFLLATGNLSSRSGLGLMQDSGLVIAAENINRMRYMSHFKSIHRGAFFQKMRTTEARQLLPDAWGFVCPVHTPDGAPCGLLNHLTKSCIVTPAPDANLLANTPLVLVSLGMTPIGRYDNSTPLSQCYGVQLDGRVLGYVACKDASHLVQQLRMLKLLGKEVPSTMEIVLLPKDVKGGLYPGLFLFTNAARMMRPVYNLAAQAIELIGTFEQVYMEICIKPEEAYPGITTHQEVSNTSFLSNLACLIPMPDCNQSPRNMYQCQMGKQTMGTPCHTFHLQSETKLYRLTTPASPLFRPVQYDINSLDDFPMGTNAIVAVISYTGYDMEDAMIINKSSFERGFGHGSILKSQFFECKSIESYFGLDPALPFLTEFLDSDGLPRPGARHVHGDPICCMFSYGDTKFLVETVKSKEPIYIDNVRLCGGSVMKACITTRTCRNPSVGDKFASRAGQKGICSRLWPTEDLPFTQSGLVPDIVFNPHGFPSRMTIAMMIELMAGKSAALHGLVHDATPFRFTEKDTAIDYFGRMLEAGGYNYYGNEKMYSGTDGRELNVQIFFGVVHYQRLRHMVSDKWQVRSTGPIDIITMQPVKGRRRGGGIRFGEMERDALLSHGASFLLQDRMFHCSDKTTVLVCKTCGSLISCYTKPSTTTSESVPWCLVCEEKGDVRTIEIPYMFKYLVTQFAAVNIKVVLEFNT